MTYKLEPGLARITSSVLLLFPDGTEKRYENGEEVVGAVFDRKWIVDEIKAKDAEIKITLKESVQPDLTFF